MGCIRGPNGIISSLISFSMSGSDLKVHKSCEKKFKQLDSQIKNKAKQDLS